MAQKEANHSSKDRTILWIILPSTVAVSLLFTKLNHSMVPTGEKLPADFSTMVGSQETHPTPAADSIHTAHGEAEHLDTTSAKTTH